LVGVYVTGGHSLFLCKPETTSLSKKIGLFEELAEVKRICGWARNTLTTSRSWEAGLVKKWDADMLGGTLS